MSNMRIRTIAAFILVSSFLLGLLPVSVAGAAGQPEGQREFTDVPADHWAYEAVQSMVRHGVVDGYEDGSFQPDGLLTREQFTKLLTLALDLNLPDVPDPTFSDVDGDRWSLRYVEAVKEYLEGYQLPIGKPFYEPNATVTREDVAVALVKGMKVDSQSVPSPAALIQSTFDDFRDVSDGYEPYIAAAIKNNLLAGYPDGTFRPKDGLNRGAAMTLLHRLLESPLMPRMKEIGLSVRMSDTVTSPYVPITGTVDPGLKLYVDDREVLPSPDGGFDTGEQLEDQEGSRDITVKAVKANGRYKAVTRKVSFVPPAPELRVTVPASTEKEVIEITGTLKDSNDDEPKLFLNGEPVSYGTTGSWSYKATLAEGANSITVSASNKYGKETAAAHTVRFTVKPPEIRLDTVPDTVYYADLAIQGSVTDPNDGSPEVTINGAEVKAGSFKKTIRLSEGANDIKIRATNRLGKTEEIVKRVQYVIKPPEISLSGLQEFMVNEKLEIQASVADLYDKQPSIYLNNSYVGKGSYKGTYTLKEGENILTFKAVSSSGKESVQSRKVVFTVLPPTLQVQPIPSSTSVKTLKVQASATDTYGTSVSIYVNDQYVGTGTIERNVTLSEGENTIKIRAVNAKNKETVQTHKITYSAPAPVLTVDPLPDTAAGSKLAIKARATDSNDSYPRLYLNNKDMGYGSMDTTLTLKEGPNSIEIKATNSAGKTTTFTKTVVYEIPAPVLTVETVPETTDQAALVLTASAADANDSAPMLYVNGQAVAASRINKSVALVLGENTFEIKAVNRLGKTAVTLVRITRVTASAPPAAQPPAQVSAPADPAVPPPASAPAPVPGQAKAP